MSEETMAILGVVVLLTGIWIVVRKKKGKPVLPDIRGRLRSNRKEQ